MNNKEQLINWMKERRENLPFESKVNLIWDYWKNKDVIPNLQKDVASWKDAYELERKLTQKLNQQVIDKDDRNAQLLELFKGTAKIFDKQHNYVDQLKKQLEKESQDKNISQEQAKHLQEDIKRLDNEKQELGQRIQELKKTEAEIVKEKNKELADLRAEKQQLENKLKEEALTKDDKSWLNKLDSLLGGEFSWTRQEMDDLIWPVTDTRILALSNHIPKPGVLKNKGINQKVIAKTLVRIFGNYYSAKTELAKEKGWWDKWIKDNLAVIDHSKITNILATLGINEPNLVTYSLSYQKGSQFRQGFNMREDYCKTAFKALYQYYRDK